MYASGKGVQQDFKQAFAWYRKAADQGDAKAQWNLGGIYASGRGGIPQDFRQASSWCRKAATLGFAPAQSTLAGIYARSAALENREQAVFWWTKAAQQDDPEAQYNLGLMYSQGAGVAQDFEQAFSWFGQAAEQGVPSAQSRLGLMYATAQAVPLDYIEAHKWFILAGDGGDDAAQKNRIHSATLMTAPQIAEARRRAKVWARTRADKSGEKTSR
jgi:TPR repeat protein